MVLNKVSILKVDKDYHVDPDWIQDYLLLIVVTCLVHGS